MSAVERAKAKGWLVDTPDETWMEAWEREADEFREAVKEREGLERIARELGKPITQGELSK